jgi:hypothetical protein
MNCVEFQEFLRELRRDMAAPAVSDADLSKLVNKLYRTDATEGSGSTAAAIRYELKTGERVGGKFHSQKGNELLGKLEDWLLAHPTASAGDRAAAENLIKDLKDAFGIPF